MLVSTHVAHARCWYARVTEFVETVVRDFNWRVNDALCFLVSHPRRCRFCCCVSRRLCVCLVSDCRGVLTFVSVFGFG